MSDRKLFGEYLIEKGHVDKDTLCGAILYQLSISPSLPESVSELGLLSSADIFDVMLFQQKHFVEFKTACKSLELWQENFDQKVMEFQMSKRPPLGEILIEKNIIDRQGLVHALDDFLGKLAKEEAKTEAAADNDKTENIVDNIINLEASEEKIEVAPGQEKLSFDFDDIEEGIAEDYFELLNSDKKSEIELLIMAWEKELSNGNIESLEENFRTLYREYHTIKGSSRFIKAYVTEKLVHEVEELLSLLQRQVNTLDIDRVTTVTNLNLKVIDVLWTLKDCMAENHNEKVFWENLDYKKLYSDLLIEILTLKKELESNTDNEVVIDDVADQF